VAAATAVLTGQAVGVLDEAQAAQDEPKVLSGSVEITLKVNGQDRSCQVEPRSTLLDTLRNRLDVTGPKRVCDRGSCGA
jgi:xanthine dehydrogenase YagT iron-sulfur-binding subunit